MPKYPERDKLVPILPSPSDRPTYTATNPKGAPGSLVAREQRRAKVWQMHLQGWSRLDIAAELSIDPSTISSDLKARYEALAPELQRDSLEHMTRFIAEMDEIIKLGRRRLERMDEIEEMWLRLAFGGASAPSLEDAPEEGPDGRPQRRRQQKGERPYVPLQPKTEHAAVLGELIKASRSKMEMMGYLRQKVDVSYDIVPDEALVELARKRGINVEALGLAATEAETVANRPALPGHKDDDLVEGEFTTIEPTRTGDSAPE